MKYYKKLIGSKVYLSPMCLDDAETYTKWLNDLSVTEKLGTSHNMVSVSGEQEWIKENSQGTQFAIIKAENDELIGNCGFNSVDQIHQCGEVGIFIGDEKNQNNGYGSEAMGLLVDFGFNYLNLNNIMLKVFSFNENAVNCYKKAGFKEIGRRRQAYYLKGKYYDQIFMDIIRSDRHECY
ncbi:GNAT family N-acetyltransferase [Lacrimispora sp.]|uniref:GNAT family N-acetyltransferase n=1 Tax=Lacrimispora sp. TaxID=2719234 RepID=UPI003460B196